MGKAPRDPSIDKEQAEDKGYYDGNKKGRQAGDPFSLLQRIKGHVHREAKEYQAEKPLKDIRRQPD
jgi:hypothetical protein